VVVTNDQPCLTSAGTGFRLIGRVAFDQVLPLYERGVVLFQAQAFIEIDLSELTHSDSGVLALLSAWMRWCLERQKTLCLQHAPVSLRRLMALCGTESLFLPDSTTTGPI